ncbi:MAG: hypothetical protein ACI4EN_10720 [Butyrivibrio sp.]
MTKRVCVLMICLIALCGCQRTISSTHEEETSGTIGPTTEDAVENEYILIDREIEGSDWEYSENHIALPENSDFGGLCLYGDNIYYSIDYVSYLYSYEESKEFADEYRTQICCYNTITGEERIMYSVEGEAVTIDGLQCNGRVLVWGQRNPMLLFAGKTFHVMDINTGEIIKPEAFEENIQDIYLTEDYLFGKAITDKGQALVRYDLATWESNILMYFEDISPMVQLCEEFNEFFTFYDYRDDSTEIYVYDADGKPVMQYGIAPDARRIKSNSRMCVWRKDEEKEYIYVYDIVGQNTYKLKTGEIYTYAISGGYLVTNGYNMKAYCVGDLKIKRIFPGSQYYSALLKGTSNNIYGYRASTDGEGIDIVNIYQ